MVTRTVALALSVLAAAGASADIIYLANGLELRGRIVSRTRDAVVVEVPRGVVRLRAEEILRIEPEADSKRLLAEALELARTARAEEALALLERASEAGAAETELAPARLKILRHEASRLEGQLRLAEAYALLSEAKKLGPSDREIADSLERVEKKLSELRELIGSARASARRGDHTAAVGLFEKALRLSPGIRLIIAGELADSYEALGDRLLEQHALESAIWYEKAISVAPERAGALLERLVYAKLLPVLEQMKRGELDAASKALDALVELAPSDVQVRYVYGKLLEARGDPSGAARHYRAALPTEDAPAGMRLDALRASVEARLRKLREEALSKKRLREERSALEDGPAKRLEGRHFIVHHRNTKLAEEVLAVAERQVEKILTSVGRIGPLWNEPCPIYLLPDEEAFLAATGQPAWSGGLSHTESVGGKLKRQYLTVYQTNPRLTLATVPHEVAHLVFSALTGYASGVPLALHEGFATLQEEDPQRPSDKGLLLWKRLAGELIPLPTLLEMREVGDEPTLFYAESASLVGFLVDTKGLAEFVAFAKELATAGPDAALRKHYGIDGVSALQKAWLEALDR